jgi:hypothetical protein
VISVRSQNTLLHSMTHHFSVTVERFRMFPTPECKSVMLEQMRRIMTAARELNPRYPAMVAKIGGKR